MADKILPQRVNFQIWIQFALVLYCRLVCVRQWQVYYVVTWQVRDLVPESQAYMDLLSFEKKLDGTIMRKRLDIQEALKRPMKVGWTMMPLAIGRSHDFNAAFWLSGLK